MIVLFTDFGLAGPYTGQMKAVIHGLAPATPVIDLFADAPTRNPRAAAYLLAACDDGFPAGTVFLAVVDPGVGGDRPPVMLEADGNWYVGPGNGLLELVARRARDRRLWEITWRPPNLSASFHGRDLFAPVAARLAGGAPPASLGQPASLALPGRDWPDDLAEIVYVDHYGNAFTGLRAGMVPPQASLAVGARRLANARTFAAVPPGTPFWYANANGLVEIAVAQGRADAVLGIAIGAPVSVGGAC